MYIQLVSGTAQELGANTVKRVLRNDWQVAAMFVE